MYRQIARAALAASLLVCCTALAQVLGFNVGGRYIASQYGVWRAFTTNAISAGPTSIRIDRCYVSAGNVSGKLFVPFAVGTPITISDGNSETVTPTAVATPATGSTDCVVSATFALAHSAGSTVKSGTGGLQEAINDASQFGGLVTIDPFWTGSNSMITAAKGFLTVPLEDIRASVTFYAWDGVSAYQISNGGGGGGSGNLSASGSPVNTQLGIFTDPTHLTGTASLTSDLSGNVSGNTFNGVAGFKVNGAALASTHLADTASLCYLTNCVSPTGGPLGNQVGIWADPLHQKGVTGLTADASGNLSANSYKVNGVALASTNLSDAGTLCYLANCVVPSGTPLIQQLGIWTDANHQKGITGLTSDNTGNLTAGGSVNAALGFYVNSIALNSQHLSDHASICLAASCVFQQAPTISTDGMLFLGTGSGSYYLRANATVGGFLLLPPLASGTDTLVSLGLNQAFTGLMGFAAGSAAAPGLYFAPNSNTGFFSTGTGNGAGIVFTQNGVAKFSLGSATNGTGSNSGGLNLQSDGTFGWSATSDPTQASDLILARGGAATLALGGSQSASPVAQTVRATNSRGGTDNNVAGANIVYQPGVGTGQATPATFCISGDAFGTASGSTQHLVMRRHCSGSAALTSGAAKTIASIPLVSLQNTGGHVWYHMEASDGTNQCSTDGDISYAGENSAGTFVTNVSTIGDASTACTAGKTLTVTWALTQANPALLQATPTLTGITATSFRMIYEASNFGQTSPTYINDAQ